MCDIHAQYPGKLQEDYHAKASSYHSVSFGRAKKRLTSCVCLVPTFVLSQQSPTRTQPTTTIKHEILPRLRKTPSGPTNSTILQMPMLTTSPPAQKFGSKQAEIWMVLSARRALAVHWLVLANISRKRAPERPKCGWPIPLEVS